MKQVVKADLQLIHLCGKAAAPELRSELIAEVRVETVILTKAGPSDSIELSYARVPLVRYIFVTNSTVTDPATDPESAAE